MILQYLIGLGTLTTLLLIWFYSPLRTSLGRIFFGKDIFSNDQFETALLIKSPFLGKLLGCYICSSFWLSLCIGLVGFTFFDLPLEFIPLVWFTYPGLAYMYKAFIDRCN